MVRFSFFIISCAIFLGISCSDSFKTDDLYESARLSNLALSAGNLVFDPKITIYNVNVPFPVSSVCVTPTAVESDSVIMVNFLRTESGTESEPITLNEGTIVISVEVSFSGKASTTYTLNVTRRGPSADLTGIELSDGVMFPVFDAAVTDGYSATVPPATTGVKLRPIAFESDATITVNGNTVVSGSQSGDIPLSPGGNIINIIVSSLYGPDPKPQKTYTLTMVRTNSSDLNNLAISSGTLTPAFNPDTHTYSVTVSETTTSVQITPVAVEGNLATINVNGENVNSGYSSGSIALDDHGIFRDIPVISQSGNSGIPPVNYTVRVRKKWWMKKVDIDFVYPVDLGDLYGVVQDSDGNVYAHSSTKIRKYNSCGIPVTGWGTNGVSSVSVTSANDSPNGNISLDSRGRVYIPTGAGGDIQILKEDGKSLLTPLFGSDQGTIRSVYVLGDGDEGSFLWFTKTAKRDAGDTIGVYKYKKVSGNWLVCDSAEWGTNGVATHADLNSSMKSIYGDSSRNIYIVQTSSNKMLKISSDGGNVTDLSINSTGFATGSWFSFFSIDGNSTPNIFIPVLLSAFPYGEIRRYDQSIHPAILKEQLNLTTVPTGIFPGSTENKITGISVSSDGLILWYAIAETGSTPYRHLIKLSFE